MLVRPTFALLAFLTFFLFALPVPSQGCVVPAFGMYHECAGHGLILDWAAFDSHGARAGDGFGLKVGGCSRRRLILRFRFGTLLGGRFDLNGECRSRQKEAEDEANQSFPESNLHFKYCALVRRRFFHHHDAADSGWEQSFEQTLFSALTRFEQSTESKMAGQVEFAIWGQSF